MSDMRDIKVDFLNNIKNHKLTIISETFNDDGTSKTRHLHCSKGSCDQSFDIVTYDNHLVISGDMGCSVFERTYDMFDFFHQKLQDGIKPRYWGSKIVSGGNGQEFTKEKFLESVHSQIDIICEDIQGHFDIAHAIGDSDDYSNVEEFEQCFRDEVDEYFEMMEITEGNYYMILDEFSSEFLKLDIILSEYCYEWLDCNDYKYSFLWHCYAIVWSIEQYNLLKESEKVKEK